MHVDPAPKSAGTELAATEFARAASGPLTGNLARTFDALCHLRRARGDIGLAAAQAGADPDDLREIVQGYGAIAVAAARPAQLDAMVRRPAIADLEQLERAGCPFAADLMTLPGIRARARRAAEAMRLAHARDLASERLARFAAGDPAVPSLTAAYLGDPAPARSALNSLPPARTGAPPPPRRRRPISLGARA